MASTVLELRQQQATQVTKNGDYAIRLPFKTQILPGDTVSVVKSFVDTAFSQRVLIPTGGVEVTVQGYKYLMNEGSPTQDGSANQGLLEELGAAAPLNATGEWFVQCREHDSAANIRIVTGVRLIADHIDGLQTVGKIRIRYTDPAGQPQENLRDARLSAAGIPLTIDGYHIAYDTAGVQELEAVWIGVSDKDQARVISIDTVASDDGGATKILEPVTYEFKTTLAAGSYSEEELVTTLNDRFQTNTPNPNDFVDGEGRAFLDLYSNADGLYYVRSDGQVVAQFKAAVDPMWVGASQVALDYVDSTSQFVWSYAHTPFYYQSKEVVGFLPNEPNDAANHHIAAKWSGFAFSALTAATSSGTQFPLWDEYMGFDLADSNSIIVAPSGIANFAGGGTTYRVPLFNNETSVSQSPTDGINLTSGYVGLASALETGTAAAPKDWFSQPTPPFYNPVAATIRIVGSQKGVLAGAESGYFLVEVDGGWTQDFYDTQNNNSRTQAIVSRYYSAETYTTGTAADSVIYTHVGAPLLTSQFRVRILNPDRTVPDNLGDGSCVFIQVNRPISTGTNV